MPFYGVINEKEIQLTVEMDTIRVMSYNNNVLCHFYQNDFLESSAMLLYGIAELFTSASNKGD